MLADLEWARLTFWREPFAQIFDNPARTNKFSNFHTIEIFHAGDKLTPSCGVCRRVVRFREQSQDQRQRYKGIRTRDCMRSE